MAITLELIKELRTATGVSINECKKALEASDGDIDAAIDELRKKGISKAAKRAENATGEGRIQIDVEDGRAYIVVASSETDFVSRNDAFGEFVDKIMSVLRSAGSVDAAQDEVEQLKSDAILQL